MKLAHFSANGNLTMSCLKSQPFSNFRSLISAKPTGLWITDMDCEDNWKNWCEAEKYNLHELRYRYNLSVDDSLLLLNSMSDLDNLLSTYGDMPFGLNMETCYINWEPIFKKYKGILITPYIWQRHSTLEHAWYWGWDCASGCIWDISAITFFQRVRP
jgi:hypothetical protein